ncbi:MAG: amidophosphoribosyltransferase [Thermodesulfobacteriota bacterium]|nr:amidophosphoribosyltransferase [Thermodesulfobacteriota bacterium]
MHYHKDIPLGPMDHPRESCGLFGIFGDPKAAEKTYLGLYALQHRGQESAGIAASNGKEISLYKGMGLVWSVFSEPDIMPGLAGSSAIGHNRYSTTGISEPSNAQPMLIQFRDGQLAAAHNGNLVNSLELRRSMENTGSIFQTTSDSEIILHLIARSKKTPMAEMLMDALSKIDGAYSLLFLTSSKLIAARDPYGFRPLCLGKLGEATIVASESCALDIVGADYIRSIEPGEVMIIDDSGLTSMMLPPASQKASCIFEYIYFSRPDSMIFGEKVDKVRRKFGKRLAEEAPCLADIVIAVPDSANTAALGYARASGMRFEIGLIRNHYVGRTFIAPHQDKRDLDVKVKFNPVTGVLKGKRVVVVEDSIVRGTTLRQLIHLIRSAGAAQIHVRVSSPPIKFPCFYGIDISKRGELIAASHSVEEIRRYIEADSLAYLSVEGMLNAVSEKSCKCTACFTGNYPTAVPKEFSKEQFSATRSDIKWE